MKKIYLFAAALAAMSLASCDINDVQNMGELSTENFPVSAADGAVVLAGIYENLNAVNANPQESFLYYAQLASDDMFGGGGVNDKMMQAEDLMCNYNQNMTNDFWVQRYQGINRANTLIQALPNTAMSANLKTQYMGEAKFLRAFYYYELASMYGNVPLKTVPSGETGTQGDVKVLWGQILQDLRHAATTMAATRLTDGHVDKYCAEAMLGRAWLFYTGFYCNGTTIADLTSTNYAPLTSVDLPDGTKLTKDDVIKCIDDCVNNSGYKLVSDFRELWAYTNKYTVEDYSYTKGQDLKWCQDDENGTTNAADVENMFAIKFNKLADWSTTIGYGNGYALHFGVRGGQAYANTFPFGQGWGAGPVAPNLVKDWQVAEPNDIRLKATVCDVNDTQEMPNYGRGGWADFVQETDYYSKKWSPIACKNDGTIPGSDGNPAPEYAFCFETC